MQSNKEIDRGNKGIFHTDRKELECMDGRTGGRGVRQKNVGSLRNSKHREQIGRAGVFWTNKKRRDGLFVTEYQGK